MTQAHVRFLWRWLLAPLLFCLIGTIINFDTLPSSTIPRAAGLIFAGAPSVMGLHNECRKLCIASVDCSGDV